MLVRDIVYYIYEARLQREVRKGGEPPRHLALILDGNRRFADTKGIARSEGHKQGADKIDDVLDWCEELGVPIITLWALSTENLSRDSTELDPLLKIIERKVGMLAENPATHRRRMRIRAIGKVELLPESTRKAIEHAEEVTRDYSEMQLNIAVGYGGRQELIDAVSRLLRQRAEEGQELMDVATSLDVDDIQAHLYTFDLPDPDLIIRTSGEVRLSGFMPWQSAYSEFYFSDVNWPDFRRIDLLRAVRNYQARRRRFGR